jgi:hypothetical protein
LFNNIDAIKETVSQTDVQINYAKEEVELRIESLKCDLDLLNGKIQAKLDRLKTELEK